MYAAVTFSIDTRSVGVQEADGVRRAIAHLEAETLRRPEGHVHLQETLGHVVGEPVLVDRVGALERVEGGGDVADVPDDGGRRDRPVVGSLPRATDQHAPQHDPGDRGGDRRCQRQRSAVARAAEGCAPENETSVERGAEDDRIRSRATATMMGSTRSGTDSAARIRTELRICADRDGERLAGGTPVGMGIGGLGVPGAHPLAIHPSRQDELRALAVHVASSSSAIARQSACRARNILLFTVPTATPRTSAVS